MAQKAQRAAENAKPVIAQATHGSPDHPLRIGDVQLVCYVLEDGRRVLVQGGMLNALDMSQGSASAKSGGDRLAKFISTKALKGRVTPELAKAIREPIRFKTPTGSDANGYEATILADICEAVLSAADEGALNYQQEHIARQCQILIRGFARVGIIALVDEATGYQDVRTREALEEILERFIADELLAWAKRFPDEFYRQLFRLRGLHYSEVSTKRPQYIGRLTNDIIYERLAPGVLDELRDITPRDEEGRRKHKYHQRLTEDVGHARLQEHLSNVLTLMRASANYRSFYRLLQRALPKYTGQLDLALGFRDELDDEIDMAQPAKGRN